MDSIASRLAQDAEIHQQLVFAVNLAMYLINLETYDGDHAAGHTMISYVQAELQRLDRTFRITKIVDLWKNSIGRDSNSESFYRSLVCYVHNIENGLPERDLTKCEEEVAFLRLLKALGGSSNFLWRWGQSLSVLRAKWSRNVPAIQIHCTTF